MTGGNWQGGQCRHQAGTVPVMDGTRHECPRCKGLFLHPKKARRMPPTMATEFQSRLTEALAMTLANELGRRTGVLADLYMARERARRILRRMPVQRAITTTLIAIEEELA